MASLNLPEDALLEVISDQILNSLSSESKDAIIGQALKHLNTPSGGYGQRETPLQTAFNEALDRTVNKMVLEVLQSDDTRMEQIKDSVEDIISKFPAIKTDYALHAKIAETIMKHFQGGGF